MVVYPRRMSSSKRGTKRRRTAGAVARTRRPTRTRPARMSRKRSVKRPGATSSASSRAYFDASRWQHSPDLGVSYTPVKGVTRKAVTALTGLGAAYYIFVWTPSQVRCMWISHQADQVDGYFRVHFPFLASH